MLNRLIVTFISVIMFCGIWMNGYCGTTSSSHNPSHRTQHASQPVQTISMSEKHFLQGKEAADQKNYTKALEYFTLANREDHNNPDILNMLAFSNRKVGRLNDAFAYYAKALELRPDFPEAREYLAEAHIQAALKELETLKSYGSKGEEQAHEVIEGFENALETARK